MVESRSLQNPPSGFLLPTLHTDSLARARRRAVRTPHNVSMPCPLVLTSTGIFIHLLPLWTTPPRNHPSPAALSRLISSPLSSPNTDGEAGEQLVSSEELSAAPSDRVQKVSWVHMHNAVSSLDFTKCKHLKIMEISLCYSPSPTELLQQGFRPNIICLINTGPINIFSFFKIAVTTHASKLEK